MPSEAMFAVFEDFNDRRDEPPPPNEAAAAPDGDADAIREAAWTEGYLAGRQEAGVTSADAALTARLLTSLHALDGSAAEAVDAAAVTVADLLLDTVIAATSDTWSARLMDRVRMVADRIRPALAVAPEFVLRDACGSEQHFGDISALSRAVEAGGAGEDVTIRWQHGEAIISRTALLEDLRDAIIPLSRDDPGRNAASV